jgi:hypothetical protein
VSSCGVVFLDKHILACDIYYEGVVAFTCAARM